MVWTFRYNSGWDALPKAGEDIAAGVEKGKKRQAVQKLLDSLPDDDNKQLFQSLPLDDAVDFIEKYLVGKYAADAALGRLGVTHEYTLEEETHKTNEGIRKEKAKNLNPYQPVQLEGEAESIAPVVRDLKIWNKKHKIMTRDERRKKVQENKWEQQKTKLEKDLNLRNQLKINKEKKKSSGMVNPYGSSSRLDMGAWGDF